MYYIIHTTPHSQGLLALLAAASLLILSCLSLSPPKKPEPNLLAQYAWAAGELYTPPVSWYPSPRRTLLVYDDPNTVTQKDRRRNKKEEIEDSFILSKECSIV